MGYPNVSPGDRITTTIGVDTSEYFTFGTITVEDTFTDGHTFSGIAPQYNGLDFTNGADYSIDNSDIGNDDISATTGNLFVIIETNSREKPIY